MFHFLVDHLQKVTFYDFFGMPREVYFYNTSKKKASAKYVPEVPLAILQPF